LLVKFDKKISIITQSVQVNVYVLSLKRKNKTVIFEQPVYQAKFNHFRENKKEIEETL
jgi:hypothetical protein